MSDVLAPTNEPVEGLNSYDEVPYPANPFAKTHPDRLHAVGRLFGMTPALPDECRVLEIGCGIGGNLIPMADQMPGSTFVGIDYSEKQISRGKSIVSSVDLSNIDLRHKNVMDVGSDIGMFDYIICHGVFSWVSDDVREKILQVCRTQLNPQGIAYISYNTFPGWHMRGMIRDMMMFHVRELKEPGKSVEQARALLTFLSQSVQGEDSAYAKLLKSELELLSQQSDSYLFHEHLEAHNVPLYFYQFVERANRANLQYLGDTLLSSMWVGNFPGEVTETLNRVAPDLYRQEQYSDFIRNRTFRQSLLCHNDVSINRNLGPNAFPGSYLSGFFTEKRAEKQGTSEEPEGQASFVNPSTKRTITTVDPALKSAISIISERWPSSVLFEDLVGEIQKQEETKEEGSRLHPDVIRQSLQGNLVQLLVSGMVNLKYVQDRFTTDLSETPAVSKFARFQATEGHQLTNQRHEVITVDHFLRLLCQQLDGETSRPTLVTSAQKMAAEGKVRIRSQNDESDSEEVAPSSEALEEAIDGCLQTLSKHAFIIA